MVKIDAAFSDGPGWLVIYNDKYNIQADGQVIGTAKLNDGLNENISVKVNMALVTPKLYAVIHKDAGTVGTFEYPGPDEPYNPRDEKIYQFYSTWPYPKADFPDLYMATCPRLAGIGCEILGKHVNHVTNNKIRNEILYAIMNIIYIENGLKTKMG